MFEMGWKESAVADEATGEQGFPAAEADAPKKEKAAKVPKPELPEDPAEGLPDPRKVGRFQFFVDVVERALWTYFQAFVAALLAADKLDWEYVTAAAFSGVVAGLAVLKAAVARFLGDGTSAAVVPRRLHNWAARKAGAPVLPEKRKLKAA